MNVGRQLTHRDNNFDFLRFFAASLVVFSHSYPITGELEPLERMANGLSFGHIAVLMFFSMSGFLIAHSFAQSKSLSNFVKARILRIYPALAVAVSGCVILGALVTSLPTPAYLANWDVKAFIFNNGSLLYFYPNLPGVFQTNPFPKTVNGSLWTLPIEIRMYAAVILFGGLGLLKTPWLGNLALIALLGIVERYPISLEFLTLPPQATSLFEVFVIGVLFYINRAQVPLRASFAFTAIVIFALVPFELVRLLAVAYLTLFCAFSLKPRIVSGWGKYGDLSYGIYIYSFPIQQTLVLALPLARKPILLFGLTYVIILPLSFLSWHGVEKPMLKLKRFKFRGVFARN